MSKKPQTMANLKEAERIKQSPFKTKIHANPAMKQEVDELLGKGIALRTIHRDMKKKYGDSMPSLSTFSNYVKMHYVPQHSVSVPKQGAAALKDFDALAMYRKDVEELDSLIKQFDDKERRMGYAIDVNRRYRELKFTALKNFIELEIKLGLIDGMIPAEVNNYGVVNNGTMIAAGDSDLLSGEELTRLDRMIAFKQEQEEVALLYAEPEEHDPNVEFNVRQTPRPELIKKVNEIHEKYTQQVELNKSERLSPAAV